ncbi:MAG: Tad domain-containing protein, partial [Bdellovibrionia bacterium]
MRKLDNRGQISVMIGVMMATFIFFFAFVINTGMLVNAKINLQNAADLAAYTGASVQARQLTNISYLNYEMRRQWKKFLYRLYVLGNHGYQSFPYGGGSGPMNYQPNPSAAKLGV